MIPLVCGDPWSEKQAAEREAGGGAGASYTCFLFPFAYRLEPDPSPNQTSHQTRPCYVPTPRDAPWWQQRRRYFTRETADVLFERAAWFEIPRDDWVRPWDDDWSYRRRFEARLCSGAVEVELAPPQLILFEWHRDGFDETAHNPFQTGFLLLETHFPRPQPNPPTLDDLLLFNERFRYWRPPFAAFAEYLRATLGNPQTEDKQPIPLLDLYLVRWLRLLELPLLSDGARRRLFPRSWGEGARAWWDAELSPVSGSVPHEHCLVYADNRAFTWTCALLEAGCGALRQPVTALYAAPDPRGPEGLGYWVKLLNVDAPGGSSAANHRTSAFEREWAKDRTYTRWAHFGTLYGFNYHAGAMLTGPMADPPTWLHFREQYLDSALLLLYVRVTLFRFSRELSDITSIARDSRRPTRARREWRRRFEALRWQFALFTNLYKFPLISNQQQAIEMYSYARRHLDVDELFQEVEEEIRASHEFLDGSTSSKINRLVFLLTGAGIALVVFQVIAWFFKSPEFGWIARTVRSVKSLIE